MALDQRDKFVRTLTLRQKWPRNVDLNVRPKWFHLDTNSPFPSNVMYERPRTVDRTPPAVVLEEGEAVLEDDPWDAFTTHAQLNNYVAEQGISLPVGWAAMTIAQKKTWLDDH